MPWVDAYVNQATLGAIPQPLPARARLRSPLRAPAAVKCARSTMARTARTQLLRACVGADAGARGRPQVDAQPGAAPQRQRQRVRW